MLKTFFITLCAAAVLAIAAWYLKPENKMLRLPASTQSGFDLSNLGNEAYVETVQEVLVNTSRVETQKPDHFQLSFAQFTSPRSQNSVCETYPWIEITLVADGMAVSGELPQLKFNTTCDPAGERVLTEVIDLKSEEVRKDHLDGYWPGSWYLQSLRLLSEDSFIQVTDDEFRTILGDVLRLDSSDIE